MNNKSVTSTNRLTLPCESLPVACNYIRSDGKVEQMLFYIPLTSNSFSVLTHHRIMELNATNEKKINLDIAMSFGYRRNRAYLP